MAKLDFSLLSTASVAGPEPVLAPTDPLAGSQWHLDAIDVKRAWDSYAGRGIRIGIVDDGFERTHPDLVGNYRTDLDYDARQGDSDAAAASGDNHGTAVAGTAAATMNNIGGAGIAWEADIVGLRIGYGSNGNVTQIVNAFDRLTGVDVANNSWGYGGYFSDDFASATFQGAAAELQAAATSGRGGLGTVVVFAAGNSGDAGDNVNYHDFQNSPYVIAVGATDSSGAIAGFSTPGAAVLVAAPGVGIVTTDRLGSAGYVGGDYVSVSGTSFAAPIVSGVAALMLEANPALGYRDVQEILAYSAQQPAAGGTWFTNGAGDWNGGGLRFNDDYGFGLVDAHAAVRLAESWTQQSTQSDRLVVTRSANPSPDLAIPEGGTVSSAITVSGTAIDIDRVEVTLDIAHTWIGDLTVSLVSPAGTTSLLVDRPGVSASSAFGASQDNIRFTVDSVQFWGEDANGTWTLVVGDWVAGDTGTLNSWSLSLIGDADTADDLYVYTDAFGALGADADRRTLTDAGGTDTIDLAAISAASLLDLRPGTTSTVAGRSLAIAAGTTIENAILGDGNDRVLGNEAANDLEGWRGADSLDGGAGNDTLTGGAANDTLSGGQGSDRAVYSGARADYTVTWSAATTSFTVTDLRTGSPDGTDLVTGIEDFVFGSQTVSAASLQTGGGGGGQTGTAGADTLNGTAADDLLAGLAGNDRLNGLAGADTLDGGAGNDTMAGGQGNDVYIVDSTRDSLSESSNQGTDLVMASVSLTLGSNLENLTLTGIAAINATGNGLANVLTGNAAANAINGQGGADTMIGGGGNDTYTVDNAGDVVIERDGEGVDLVQSSVAQTLADFVDNLTLTGSSAIAGTGNALANVITGNGGANTLSGGGGADTIVGGNGRDLLYGGADADLFVYRSTGESARGSNRDIIADFDAEDRIDLSAIDADTRTSGNQAFTFIGTAAFSGGAGQLRYVVSGSDLTIQVDTNRDRTADLEIQLKGVTRLDALDFIL
ncbi:S8 family serine peptidase [Stella sp.]|uniref:S8 family serine peptidase n=1 Tax=Stella sp. TaxID=2912054 RepID=UPI0035B1A1DA